MGLFSHTWIGCLFALLPGPNNLKFHNAQFRLLPVDRINEYCPGSVPERDVDFYFYPRQSPREIRKLQIGDDVTLSSSSLNLSLPTVIYFPAFFEGMDSTNVGEVREAYLKKGSHNFIVVDSARLNAGPWYPTAVTNTLTVGRHAAAFADYLLFKGLPSKNLHFVGLSIGAHRAGVAGRHMKLGKPARITGLDPASLLFETIHSDMRLRESDAHLVDVIHTDRNFGIFHPIGHVDFFVDPDVYPQPGCSIWETIRQSKGFLFTIFCSHLRSNKLFAASVTNPMLFLGHKCYTGGRRTKCMKEDSEFMGPKTSTSARGVYLVRTVPRRPEVNYKCF